MVTDILTDGHTFRQTDRHSDRWAWRAEGNEILWGRKKHMAEEEAEKTRKSGLTSTWDFKWEKNEKNAQKPRLKMVVSCRHFTNQPFWNCPFLWVNPKTTFILRLSGFLFCWLITNLTFLKLPRSLNIPQSYPYSSLVKRLFSCSHITNLPFWIFYFL